MTKERFTTPVMRFVQGDVDTAQDKDANGQLRVVKTGPNAGQPSPQYFVAGAIAKSDPAWPAFWAALCAKAAADFPNLFPQGPTGPCVHPSFAFKVIDGDSVDTSGKLWSTREGFAGHWVVRFGSGYAPRCFHAGRYAANEQIQEKGAIKRGYFIRISGTVEGNNNAQKPGLYLNLDMVELAAYGPEIVSGPDAGEAFGGGPAALPAGATMTPPTPTAGPGPGAPPLPGATAPVVPVAPVAGPGTSPPPIAGPGAPPAYDGYMGGNATLPPAPGAPVAALPATTPAALPPPVAPLAPIASPSSPVMLPAAGQTPYAAYIAAGWTDDTLRAHGYIA